MCVLWDHTNHVNKEVYGGIESRHIYWIDVEAHSQKQHVVVLLLMVEG